MGVQAMKCGKHVAIEVPAAMTMDEIWEAINTSEQTRKHCIHFENCIYDFFELTCLNMAQQRCLRGSAPRRRCLHSQPGGFLG